MLPPAPPRLSITTGWPSAAAMPFWIMRAAKSVCPPGGKPTTIVTGRDGHACARASMGAERPAASAARPLPSAARRGSGGEQGGVHALGLLLSLAWPPAAHPPRPRHTEEGA